MDPSVFGERRNLVRSPPKHVDLEEDECLSAMYAMAEFPVKPPFRSHSLEDVEPLPFSV